MCLVILSGAIDLLSESAQVGSDPGKYDTTIQIRHTLSLVDRRHDPSCLSAVIVCIFLHTISSLQIVGLLLIIGIKLALK